MAIYEGEDLTTLFNSPCTPEARRHYHAVDISESIWNRMQELNINQTQLAEMLGKSNSQVSRMLSAQYNMTLQTISELEHVLGITLADTTPYEVPAATHSRPETLQVVSTWKESIDVPAIQTWNDDNGWGMVA